MSTLLTKTKLFLTFWITHTPISPTKKTIKAQQQIQRSYLKSLKWHQQNFPR